MTQLVALASAPTAPWLLSPAQSAGIITEAACVLATATAIAVVYASGSNDVIPAGTVVTLYGGTTTQFDRAGAGPWLVITVRTSLALQVVREADLGTVTGDFAVLARITRHLLETNPPAAGIGGGGAFQWVTKTANYTITAADIAAGHGIAVDASGGNVTITLPTAVSQSGLVAIKRIDATYPTHTVTIATSSSQTIDGGTSAVLTAQGHGYLLGSDNSNWDIAAGFFPSPLTAHGQEAVGDANAVPFSSASGATIGAAAGAASGTTPPAPVVSGTTDSRGVITFGTGTGPAAGAQVAATFASSFAAAPVVVITPLNSATQALGLYVSAYSTTGFTISSASAPAASQANTTYAVAYIVEG